MDRNPLLPPHPLLRLLDSAERTLLCLLLTAMIGLACLQIVLRTVFGGGLLWADSLLRYLVLWTGLLGAVTATGLGKHIALDLTGGRLSKRVEPWLNLIAALFSSLAACGLTWAGWLFVQSEIEYGGEGPLGLPLWFWHGIFPVAFGLIAVKYLVIFAGQLRALLGSAGPAGRRP